MKLDLRQIARQPGAVLPFACELDLSGFEWNENRPLAAPVHVEGEVRNMAGAMLLTATLTGELSLVCDRCAKSFSKTKTVEYETASLSWTNCWGMCLSSIWTQRTSALRIARAFAPAAART